MEADGLFVYGPLREGGHEHAWLARTMPEGACAAWTAGRLFHLPAEVSAALVPGAEPDTAPPGPGWVAGEFVGYDGEEALDAALADLDQLMGVEEERFVRRVLPTLMDSGLRYHAWVYIFEADRLPRLERHALELPGGDWSPYLDRRD